MQRFVTAAVFFAAIVICPALFAQTAPPSDVVIGSGSFSPIVRDLDKSIDFYNNLFEIVTPAVVTPRPYSGVDTALLNFLGTPTAQVRYSHVRIPGTHTNVEIGDVKDIAR